jgi:hypothetical protein
MSLTAFKRKSVINHGSKRSGIAPGGVWLPQGPFGHSTNGLQLAIKNPGPVGFSINGGRRNVGGVGKDMKMSKSGTPYRGTQPIGWGGKYGKYASATLVGSVANGIQTTGAIKNAQSKSNIVEPVLNSRIVETMGSQHLYIKPSVLSTYGMLAKKYRWVHNGKYPNYWVQPIYTGNQIDSSSQGLYIQNLASANTCNLKVNNVGTYEGHIVKSGPTLCTPGRSTAMFKYNDMVRNAPYTKTLNQPVSYGQYNLHLTRGCNNPIGPQKPFPFAVQTGTGIKTGGTSVTSVGSACGTSNTYLTPPSWYTEEFLKQTFTSNTPNNGSYYYEKSWHYPNGVVLPRQKIPFIN